MTPTPTIFNGDCIEVMRLLPDSSIDAIVTDPPYGLGFMGKAWDSPARMVGQENQGTGKSNYFLRKGDPGYVSGNAAWYGHNDPRRFQQWCEGWTAEAFRVLKPGGHLLAFGGTRTWHRLACAVEDAGFEMRDSIAWLYGSGFPKSLDVSKAIDKAAGAEREVVGVNEKLARYMPNGNTGAFLMGGCQSVSELANLAENGSTTPNGEDAVTVLARKQSADERFVVTAPATEAAQQWQGWGTALKPAFEPVVHARKPLNTVPLGGEVARLHHLIGALLWLSLSPAKHAELTSRSSRIEPQGGVCASALVLAEVATSRAESAETDTFSSPGTASTSWSIEQSWSAILAALSDPTRMSTTSTRSSTTTGLRILNSLLAPLTSRTTMPQCGCLVDGRKSSVSSADRRSTVEWASWLHTLSASALGLATSSITSAVALALAVTADESSSAEGEASSAGQSATTSAPGSASPAFEPVVVARKPLVGTVAQNVLAHGTGALNIDGCRIGTDSTKRTRTPGDFGLVNDDGWTPTPGRNGSDAGRWPANVVLDEDQAAALDQQSGTLTSGANPKRRGVDGDRTAYGDFAGQENADPKRGVDKGGASRFFYVARKDETCAGSDGSLSTDTSGGGAGTGAQAGGSLTASAELGTSITSPFLYVAKAPKSERPVVDGVAHPTVKPLALMRWLVRLVTPPGGLVLDPFAGSGTTVEAALLEGFDVVGIERDETYLPLIQARIDRTAGRTLATPSTEEIQQ